MSNFAEVFSPGEILRDELEARGWNQTELAEIIGRPVRVVNEIIAGKKSITPDTATQIGECLGTGAEFWMNLESQYQLSKVRKSDDTIARKARLYERFPVREMVKRGWVTASNSIEVLEAQFLKFFELSTLNDKTRFCHAAKKTDDLSALSQLQAAWLFRAKQLASEVLCSNFVVDKLELAIHRLSALLSAPEEARHVPGILREAGVRLVVVEPIAGSKIDGACFWLSDAKPVIALSLRLDRIDNFWFVLRHELEHVRLGHGRDRGFILDQEIDSQDESLISSEEKDANRAAANFCVDQRELEGFIARVSPYFREDRMLGFAQRLRIHPGLVVGHLQRKTGRYDIFKKYQVKIRPHIAPYASTDGWGSATI